MQGQIVLWGRQWQVRVNPATSPDALIKCRACNNRTSNLNSYEAVASLPVESWVMMPADELSVDSLRRIRVCPHIKVDYESLSLSLFIARVKQPLLTDLTPLFSCPVFKMLNHFSTNLISLMFLVILFFASHYFFLLFCFF